jgi:hypothetical protein
MITTRTQFSISAEGTRRPRFGFAECGFFGRWIRRQRPFPAAAGDDVSLATCEPAAVFQAKVLLVMKL